VISERLISVTRLLATLAKEKARRETDRAVWRMNEDPSPLAIRAVQERQFRFGPTMQNSPAAKPGDVDPGLGFKFQPRSKPGKTVGVAQMPDYYAEIYQPDGVKAEAWLRCDSFDDAMDWLDKRKSEDPTRILRIRGPLTDDERERLARRGNVEWT